jgi:hypothetical protein
MLQLLKQLRIILGDGLVVKVEGEEESTRSVVWVSSPVRVDGTFLSPLGKKKKRKEK